MSLENILKKLKNLNEKVPRRLSLPTKSQVVEIENILGVTFHSDFRKYLLEASDIIYGTKEPVTIASPNDHTFLLTVLEDCRKVGMPDNLIPICYDNGDCYAINFSGEVVFWSHNGKTDEKWESLADWINEVWIGENS